MKKQKYFQAHKFMISLNALFLEHPNIVTLPILYCKLQKKTQLQKKERDQR